MSAARDNLNRAESIEETVYNGIESIGDFVLTEEFQRLLTELYSLPHAARAKFVEHVVLDPRQRHARGIQPPPDLIIQRSTFADGRPTLFCVSKLLPLAYPWHRVTITFDSAKESVV